MNSIQQQKLLTSLQKLPTETEWLEFKENRAEPEDIGEYISALSNTAKLKDVPFGYFEQEIAKTGLDSDEILQLLDYPKYFDLTKQPLPQNKDGILAKLSADSLLPENEEIGQALRIETRMYPELAIRELVANALIHQDFNIPGAGPMVEIFDDRMEITNPGIPLVDPLRMMDEPPSSRNESLASLMRRMNICEERGSGIDKVISEVEIYQLPAPNFTLKTQSMVVTLYSHQEFRHMSKSDRIRACYQHACLKYLSNEQLTNTSLRARFNLDNSSSHQVSRIIRETVNEGLIKLSDPNSKSRKYIPQWA